jgi:hypothetical protein
LRISPACRGRGFRIAEFVPRQVNYIQQFGFALASYSSG